MDPFHQSDFIPLSTAAATIYQRIEGAAVRDPDEELSRVAHAVSRVVPIYVDQGFGRREATPAELMESSFQRGATVLVTTGGAELRSLFLRRRDLPLAVAIIKGAGIKLKAPRAGSEPIHELLNGLVRAAQHVLEDSRAAIFIADLEHACLRFGAAHGMSESYTKAVDRFPIDPGKPSCGKAAFTGKAVIVADVAQDPLWAPFLRLAEEHGIRACWSFPMYLRDGTLLGTFALYHAKPREPNAAEYEKVEYFAKIAAQAIERHGAVPVAG